MNSLTFDLFVRSECKNNNKKCPTLSQFSLESSWNKRIDNDYIEALQNYEVHTEIFSRDYKLIRHALDKTSKSRIADLLFQDETKQERKKLGNNINIFR